MTTLKEIAEKFPKSYIEAVKDKKQTDIKTLSIRFFTEQNTDSFVDLCLLMKSSYHLTHGKTVKSWPTTNTGFALCGVTEVRAPNFQR